MKAAEIRDMRSDELQAKLEELQKQVFTLRSQAMTENVENVRAMKNVKRDIARVKTIIRENEIKGQ
ncbi:50S ribosomal protein L29 [Anaerohalosphaera lusitana]|uniref:Large ribosomal subunit protein uL29 n=1 Tax=Anaerohalosphaera lusitana TaxID=1936003 RepID=A0A1U9NPU1_9BACT|nr:50S ribosomal protein L29 [Anaerohalosphaera lusitana]AQT69845.1 50S ribosomal protein L29 [Anaerohalosphaera lusitana]